MRRFVHLGFNSGATFTFAYRPTVEKFLDANVDDWFRYGSQNYVVYTDRDMGELAQGIQALPGLNHFTVFLSEFEPLHTCNGLMPQEFWDWLNKGRPYY